MKRILLIALTLLAVTSLQAQLVKSTPKETPQGLLIFDKLIGGASYSDGTEVEPFLIEANLVDTGVLIQELRFEYVAYTTQSCIESMRLRVRRSAPERIVGGLVSHKVEGYVNVDIVEVGFNPDKDMTHWTGAYVIGMIPPEETCEVEFLDCKCILKKDFQRHLIDPDK